MNDLSGTKLCYVRNYVSKVLTLRAAVAQVSYICSISVHRPRMMN